MIPLRSARGWCVSLRSNRTRTSHTLGVQAQPPRCCAQAKLKEQAKERQQVELAERKRVAAQQEAAWVKFEQERQAIAEVEKAEEAKARAEASAMRRLAMMSGREPKPSGTPVENLQNIIGGKSSKKQKARKSSKGKFDGPPDPDAKKGSTRLASAQYRRKGEVIKGLHGWITDYGSRGWPKKKVAKAAAIQAWLEAYAEIMQQKRLADVVNTPFGRRIQRQRYSRAWHKWVESAYLLATAGAQKALPGQRAAQWLRSKRARRAFVRWRSTQEHAKAVALALPRLPYGQLLRAALGFWANGDNWLTARARSHSRALLLRASLHFCNQQLSRALGRWAG